MKCSRKNVENAILFFAEVYNKNANYKAIMETEACLPKIVHMIVYDMFLGKFDQYYCCDEEYKQYKIIHEFATELKQKGWVDFE